MIFLKKAIINISTIQIQAASKQEEIVELITEAVIYKDSGDYYIIYEESEISGLEGTTTTLKINETKVSMKREGNNTSVMEFEKGKRYKTSYKTEYGNMFMELLTKKVETNINEEPLTMDIKIEYEIVIKDMFEGKNKMHIKVN